MSPHNGQVQQTGAEMSWLKTKLFYLKFRTFKKGVFLSYAQLKQRERLSPDELDEINWSKTKALIHHAYNVTPFYKKRFDQNSIDPRDIKTPQDFTRIPFLTRDDLRNHFHELIAKGVNQKHFSPTATGGSTGVPVKVLLDKRVPASSIKWRVYDWWNVSPAANMAKLWRASDAATKDTFSKRLKRWPVKIALLDVSEMSKHALRGFVDEFNELKPEVVQGYVGSVDYLASFVEENKLRLSPPKAIWVTGSPFSSVQRSRIERVFDAPLYDQYGSSEVNWMACQCGQRRGLHIMHDLRRIEFINGEGAPCGVGDEGDISVTDLENYCFPLIRYLNGDRGRLLDERCACGVTLPLMDCVKGRNIEHVRVPDGTVLSAAYLTTIFDDCPEAVKSFRIKQDEDYTLHLRFVPNKAYPLWATAVNEAESQLKKRTHNRVRILVEETDHIGHVRGKLQFISSDVPAN